MQYNVIHKENKETRSKCTLDNLKYIIVIAKGKLQTLTYNTIVFMYILTQREQKEHKIASVAKYSRKKIYGIGEQCKKKFTSIYTCLEKRKHSETSVTQL